MRRVALVVLLAGCPDETSTLPDGSVRDASPDAGARDGGPDAAADAGPTDTGGIDATADAGDMDAAVMDATATDAGEGDGGDAGSMPCTMDQDCAPAGWCRLDEMGSGMSCAAWAEEGDFCSGFVPPWAEERCNPDGPLQCNPFVFIPDAPGICSIPATVAELLANPMAYDGHVVNIASAYTVEKNRTCTPAMPCNAANACAAEEHLGDTQGAATAILLASTGLVPFLCSGDECDYAMNCQHPLDAHVVVTGTFHAQVPPVIEVLHINDAL
jgi:hypothetical protein